MGVSKLNILLREFAVDVFLCWNHGYIMQISGATIMVTFMATIGSKKKTSVAETFKES